MLKGLGNCDLAKMHVKNTSHMLLNKPFSPRFSEQFSQLTVHLSEMSMIVPHLSEVSSRPLVVGSVTENFYNVIDHRA